MTLTIKDIARMAHVSTTTVSKIINHKDQNISQKTRDKVNHLIKTHNYTPSNVARSLVTKRSKTIGLIIPDVRNPFFTDLVRGVEDVSEAKGYNVFFCNTDESLKKEINSIQALTDKMVEGIVIVPSTVRDDAIEKHLNVNIPMVTIDREAKYPNVVGRVKTNNYTGSYEAVKYLIKNGHTRIAFISGPIDILPSLDRKKGFLDACADHHISADDHDIFIGQFNAVWGEEVVNRLKQRYTAFFCGNDLIAAGVVRGLIKKGVQIPNEVSVVGFDDIALASFIHPALTTVRQESYLIGKKATEILISSIENDGKVMSSDVILDTKLIIRNSTGKAVSCE